MIQAAVFLSLLQLTVLWIVPQPKENVWRTLAQAMGQDHICLSQASAKDPISSCLMGIPFKEAELLPALLRIRSEYKKAPGRTSHALEEFRLQGKINLPVINPLVLWRDWVAILPKATDEPQEVKLLSSSPAPFCMRFVYTPPKDQEKSFSCLLQIKEAYLAGT
ncbi:hypothetical protein HGM15179_007760 [Zosterops borbonicus]|uniref:Uncharacterized protein n=1 Tax=Zosterops borbonicus TaxID=364589 RepID=A0A8K1GJS9_9PASS|nr:hypothetical protein HGM15179_007760 [Zosterops borbonicus]